MRNPNEYSIELNLYNKNNPVEITRFFSVVFDTSKVNLSTENKENLVDELYKKTKVKRKDDSFNEIFLSLIDKNVPPIPENLLFMRNIEKVDLDLILNYEYRQMACGGGMRAVRFRHNMRGKRAACQPWGGRLKLLFPDGVFRHGTGHNVYRGIF